MALGPIVYVYAETKIAGFMQDRIGPKRVGPHGMLQTVADAVKLMFKEAIFPAGADKMLFMLAPCLVVLGAFLSFVVIPFGVARCRPADLNVGVFYVVAVSSLSTVGPDHGGLGLQQQVRAVRRHALGRADRLLRDPGGDDPARDRDDRGQPVAAGHRARRRRAACRTGSSSATSR